MPESADEEHEHQTNSVVFLQNLKLHCSAGQVGDFSSAWQTLARGRWCRQSRQPENQSTLFKEQKNKQSHVGSGKSILTFEG